MPNAMTCPCGAQVDVVSDGEPLVTCPACGAIHPVEDAREQSLTMQKQVGGILSYATPAKVEEGNKTDLGWKIGAVITGGVSGLSCMFVALALVALTATQRDTPKPLIGQTFTSVIGLFLAFGLWQRSSFCRVGWVVLVTLSAIGFAFRFGRAGEMWFEGGSAVVYAVAFVGPAAWLVLLDRASRTRVIIGTVLVGLWYLATNAVPFAFR